MNKVASYIGLCIALLISLTLVPFDSSYFWNTPKITPLDSSIAGRIALASSSTYRNYVEYWKREKCIAQTPLQPYKCYRAHYDYDTVEFWTEFEKSSPSFRSNLEKYQQLRKDLGDGARDTPVLKDLGELIIAESDYLYSKVLVKRLVATLPLRVYVAYASIILCCVATLIFRRMLGNAVIWVFTTTLSLIRTLLRFFGKVLLETHKRI